MVPTVLYQKPPCNKGCYKEGALYHAIPFYVVLHGEIHRLCNCVLHPKCYTSVFLSWFEVVMAAASLSSHGARLILSFLLFQPVMWDFLCIQGLTSRQMVLSRTSKFLAKTSKQFELKRTHYLSKFYTKSAVGQVTNILNVKSRDQLQRWSSIQEPLYLYSNKQPHIFLHSFNKTLSYLFCKQPVMQDFFWICFSIEQNVQASSDTPYNPTDCQVLHSIYCTYELMTLTIADNPPIWLECLTFKLHLCSLNLKFRILSSIFLTVFQFSRLLP